MSTGTKPPCCGSCKREFNTCRIDVACCTKCHFSWEERHLFPFLPAAQRHRLAREHKLLKAQGYPYDAVMEHSEREEQLFRRYVAPYRPDLVEQVERDHDEFAAGTLHPGEEV